MRKKQADDGSEALMIKSTSDPDGSPVCLVTWGELQWAASVEAVRKTALDLTVCAAYAEMMMALVLKLGLPGSSMALMITDILRDNGYAEPGHADTVMLLPAGSTKAKKAVVLLERGKKKAMVETSVAKMMALQWLEVAEATESDQLLSEALRGTGLGEESGRVFGYLRQLRIHDDQKLE
jgi:hypothetical protein